MTWGSGTAMATRTALALLAATILSTATIPSVGRAETTPASSEATKPTDDSEQELIRKIEALNWQGPPGPAQIAGKANIKINPGFKFLSPPDSSTFIELQRNPPIQNLFILAPTDYRWFSGFSFESTGYVKDDERIDPDAILKTLKEQNSKGIEERKRLNLPILTLTGWYIPPHYDKDTKRLEWGTRLVDEQDKPSVNYTVRILGRSGVMDVLLVSSPERLDQDLIEFKKSLETFSYNSGEGYSEFKQGDKIAQYGLTALIVGGAAAVAAKSAGGLIKFFWVGIVGVFAAITSFFRNLFKKKK